jgi:mannose-6-phosphate isomerase-like protein (cupin superfamily)
MPISKTTIEPQLFNVFLVSQIAPDTFLEGIAGVDYIRIEANLMSEIHRHNQSDNLVFIIRGTAEVFLENNYHPICPGMRITIPRKIPHGFRTSNEALEFVSVQIPPILDQKNRVFDREILPTA